MQKILPLLIALVVVTTWGPSAFAATADFQANCTGRSPTFCVFDATRTSSWGSGTSCGSASVSQYFWDFDDGTSFFTTSSFVSHTFTGLDAYLVDLAVFCSDGSSATQTICVNTSVFGANGCAHPGDGWAP